MTRALRDPRRRIYTAVGVVEIGGRGKTHVDRGIWRSGPCEIELSNE
jgi:hypothetical protein